ncbi:cell division protein FtsQ/DivIB [Caulobacter endophyticus]|uniref:cell division protein FtsQ/DivIB n=1 Tax=Caulobacter endophyticus TaxID=2172652 RepID=UPI00240F242B|nr:cell division protein FtsQ/DivIB [Caulobacter endophyticus]MDG2530102.1 cell division protein FtsQ/DivIB [Caulobacter endophyticus]
MPAAVRGGPRKPARPRAEAPAGPNKARPAQQQPAGKLHAARGGVGVSPTLALGVAGGALALALIVTLATGHRAERLGQAMVHGVDGEFANLGFKLKAVHVTGASPTAQADILKASGLYQDQPTLGMDLVDLKTKVEGVGWVKSAKVVRLLPDTVMIAVEERPALAVWQHSGRLKVIDAEGRIIREADAARFPHLPLVVGQGADQAAGNILPAVNARPRLRDRLEALVRVDDRRWDLRLKDGSLIQLPAIDEESALIQLDQLDQRQRILDLGFARIDLRDPEMVAIRPRDTALPGQLVANGA